MQHTLYFIPCTLVKSAARDGKILLRCGPRFKNFGKPCSGCYTREKEREKLRKQEKEGKLTYPVVWRR